MQFEGLWCTHYILNIKQIIYLGEWHRRNIATVEISTSDMLTSLVCWRNIRGLPKIYIHRVYSFHITFITSLFFINHYNYIIKVFSTAFIILYFVNTHLILPAVDVLRCSLLFEILDFNLLKLVRILKLRNSKNAKGNSPIKENLKHLIFVFEMK